MSNITLWIPAVERPSWVANTSWWNLQTPDDTRLHFYKSPANNVKYSWNKAVLDFLNTTDEWLFSVHSDIVVHPKTLLRLLSWDKPLVNALIFMRQGPALPHIWKTYNADETGRMVMRITETRAWFFAHKEYIVDEPFVMDPRPEDAIVETTFTSTGCTLIHRSVLEAMRPLVNDIWFQWDDDLAGGGEDRRFFTYAAEAGFPVFVDRSAGVGHLMENTAATAFHFIAWDSISTWKDTGEMTEDHQSEPVEVPVHDNI